MGSNDDLLELRSTARGGLAVRGSWQRPRPRPPPLQSTSPFQGLSLERVTCSSVCHDCACLRCTVDARSCGRALLEAADLLKKRARDAPGAAADAARSTSGRASWAASQSASERPVVALAGHTSSKFEEQVD